MKIKGNVFLIDMSTFFFKAITPLASRGCCRPLSTRFSPLVFVEIKQMRCNVVTSELYRCFCVVLLCSQCLCGANLNGCPCFTFTGFSLNSSQENKQVYLKKY